VRDGQRAREIGQEDDARLQRRHEERLPSGERGGELLAELRDAAGDLLPRQVDLPDRMAVRRKLTG
jgi:hypothetical protein